MIARALSIAGSDSSGGAGIAQDLKTFDAYGVWGTTAVTAITAQSAAALGSWQEVPPDLVAEQIMAAVADGPIGGAKTGMLPTVAVIEAVVRAVQDAGISALVVDPVLVSTAGGALTKGDTVDALRALLLPRALVVTPNIDEAFTLTGVTVDSRSTQVEAAHALRALGARAAIVTGGHVDGVHAVDVLVDEEGVVHDLIAARVLTGAVHGTGCVFSAAIAAGLALGLGVHDAARRAKGFVTGAIQHRGLGASANPAWQTRIWPHAGHPFE